MSWSFNPSKIGWRYFLCEVTSSTSVVKIHFWKCHDSDTHAKSLKQGFWVWGPSTTDLIKIFPPVFCWKVICWLPLSEKLAFISVPKYYRFLLDEYFPQSSTSSGLYLGSIQAKFTFYCQILHTKKNHKMMLH